MVWTINSVLMKTQEILADTVVSQLHIMEQMSSDEHLGSLAEAVLEALKGHSEAGAKVTAVRTATRDEKKKMAMTMRGKQLTMTRVRSRLR